MIRKNKPILFEINWASGIRNAPDMDTSPCLAIIKPVGLYKLMHTVTLFEKDGGQVLQTNAGRIAAYIVRNLDLNPGMVVWLEYTPPPCENTAAQPAIDLITFSWKWNEKRWKVDDQDWMRIGLGQANKMAGVDLYVATQDVGNVTKI